MSNRLAPSSKLLPQEFAVLGLLGGWPGFGDQLARRMRGNAGLARSAYNLCRRGLIEATVPAETRHGAAYRLSPAGAEAIDAFLDQPTGEAVLLWMRFMASPPAWLPKPQ